MSHEWAITAKTPPTPAFFEFWAGVNELSNQVYDAGFAVAHPIEAYPGGQYQKHHDLTRRSVKAFFLKLLRLGWCGWAHFGIPCKMWSALALINGGSRRRHMPLGSGQQPAEVQANVEVEWMVTAIYTLLKQKAWVTIENPWASILFYHPAVVRLLDQGCFFVYFDQCMHGLRSPSGAPKEIWRKGTFLLTNASAFAALQRTCSGLHKHAQILGTIKVHGRCFARSALAGRYPVLLCKRMAQAAVAQKACDDSGPAWREESESAGDLAI